MTDTVIVLDFETTGLSPDQGARPTEVAAVTVQDGKIVASYQSLMNAMVNVPQYIKPWPVTGRVFRRASGMSRRMGRGVLC